MIGDIIGTIKPPTRDGDFYFSLFVDEKLGYIKAFTTKTKDGFVTASKDVISYFEKHGHKVKSFRSDSEQMMKWGPVKQLSWIIKPSSHNIHFLTHTIKTK